MLARRAPSRLLVSDETGLLEVAIEAARMAGALLTERARQGAERDVSAKSTPTDLVSEADLASQHAIRELIRARRSDDGFLGEEEGEAEQGDSGLSWVVDPLDGTINYLFGIPQWSVSVAVRDGAGTIAGVVYDPNRDELFSATRTGRPTLERDGERIALAPPGTAAPDGPGDSGGAARVPARELARAMVATGFAYDIRRFGSAALDLTWTAAGRFDAYFERSVKAWDIAAGQLICERAGLQVLELHTYENLPWGILVAPPALAKPLHEIVGGP
jgi:myo-inositol-1(or 4)-monophosphatase